MNTEPVADTSHFTLDRSSIGAYKTGLMIRIDGPRKSISFRFYVRHALLVLSIELCFLVSTFTESGDSL